MYAASHPTVQAAIQNAFKAWTVGWSAPPDNEDMDAWTPTAEDWTAITEAATRAILTDLAKALADLGTGATATVRVVYAFEKMRDAVDTKVCRVERDARDGLTEAHAQHRSSCRDDARGTAIELTHRLWNAACGHDSDDIDALVTRALTVRV